MSHDMLHICVSGTREAPLNAHAVVHAFPRVGGRGTQGCIASALKRGIEVWEVPVDGHGCPIPQLRSV